jgi:hypothetical protein
MAQERPTSERWTVESSERRRRGGTWNRGDTRRPSLWADVLELEKAKENREDGF